MRHSKYLWLVLAIAMPLLAQPQQHDPCWGSDKPCADGKYRDWQGSEQPETCNNNHDNTHPCHCVIADTDGAHCPPDGLNPMRHDMGPTCSTYCRTEACKCVNQCDFNADPGK